MTSAENPRPFRLVLPGAILQEEIEARGWTQRALAAKLRRPYQVINEIIRGRKQITAMTALALARVLGTSAEFWMNLEVNYQLDCARRELRQRKSKKAA